MTAALGLLERARIDLVKLIREGIPEREYVPGGHGWALRGKRYLLFSPSGVGKSLGFLIAAVEIVRQGGTVTIADVENGADEYARRLEMILGEDRDLADACSQRLRYYEYPALSLIWGEEEWVAALADSDVVVFDSSRHVLSSLGLAEDGNDDYAQFMAKMVMPLSKAGKTTVILDNTGHEGDHPRGASAKRDLNEVLFSLTTPDGDLDLEHERRLIWRRTRGRFASSIPQALEQRIGGGTYTAPEPVEQAGGEADDPFRPTYLMEQVSRHVEYEPGASSTNIETSVKGKADAIRLATRILVEEGWMRRESGPRNSSLHYSVTPYREDEDEADDPVSTPSPTLSQGPGVELSRPRPPTASSRKGEAVGTRSDNHSVPDSVPADRVPRAAVESQRIAERIREQMRCVPCSCVSPGELADDGRCSRCWGWPRGSP